LGTTAREGREETCAHVEAEEDRQARAQEARAQGTGEGEASREATDARQARTKGRDICADADVVAAGRADPGNDIRRDPAADRLRIERYRAALAVGARASAAFVSRRRDPR